MLDAVYAEALKLRRHRATWLMVWIFPILAAVATIIAILHGMVTPSDPAAELPTAEKWLSSSAIFWMLPTQAGIRFLIAGFVALVFAGEYGWNTWKLIIPARARWQLIVAKWIVAFGFLFLAFLVADLILLLAGVLDGDIPEGVTFGAVLDTHLRAAGHTLLPIAFTIAMAALFAVLTQSILASVILSIALMIIEGLTPLLAVFAYQYLPAITEPLVRFLPFYHMGNVLGWAKGAGMQLPLGPDTVIAYSWGASFAILGAWTMAMGAATLLRFTRQDLN